MSVKNVINTVSFILIVALSGNSKAQPDARIIYAADLPIIGTAKHGDYAELATLVTESRLKSNETPHFFLFGGASLAPSPLASFDSGSHIVDILNIIEPDAMSVTKREFSYFEDELTLRSYEAAFPFLLSNAIDKESGEHLDGIYSNLVVNKMGFSLGVISILHPKIGEQYLLQRLIIQNPQNTVIRIAEQMRKEGVSAIMLMHSDHFPFINEMLEDRTIDFAIQSEPHDVSNDMAAVKPHFNSINVNTLGTAAVIDVNLGEPTIELSVTLVELSSLDAEPNVAATINTYKSRLASQLQRPIGKVTTEFDTIRRNVRNQENSFANLITAAMKSETQSECALINGGIIRGNRSYSKNHNFMQGDLLEELPFRTRMVVLEVTGEQIRQALENGVSQMSESKGRFPHVSGITFSVAPNNTIGNRVSNIQINGQVLQSKSTYTLATTDYIAQGGDGFDMFKLATRLFDKAPTTPLISDVLARYLRSQNTITPYLDGRIEFVGTQSE